MRTAKYVVPMTMATMTASQKSMVRIDAHLEPVTMTTGAWSARFAQKRGEMRCVKDAYVREGGRRYARVTGVISAALGMEFPTAASDPLRYAAFRRGMARGSALDEDVGAMLKGEPVYVEETEADAEVARRRGELASFTVFWSAYDAFGLDVVGVQVPVASDERGIAGTADLVAVVKDARVAQEHLPNFTDARQGDVVIIDVKRTAARTMETPYPFATPSATPGLEHVLRDSTHTYRLQLTAYRHLFRETYDVAVKANALFVLAYHHKYQRAWRMWPVESWCNTFDAVTRVYRKQVDDDGPAAHRGRNSPQ